MFSKTKKDGPNGTDEGVGAQESTAHPVARPAPSTPGGPAVAPRATVPTPNTSAAAPAAAPAPRAATVAPARSAERRPGVADGMSGATVQNPAPRPAVQQGRGVQNAMQETGKLIVGREIKMKGEITSCERLVVEGSVEAALMDSRALEVASGGYFTGTAVVDSAQIAGHFEGDLTVEGLLTLASTGRIIGTIRFGELEVERGGTMTGDVAIAGTPARAPALRGSEG